MTPPRMNLSQRNYTVHDNTYENVRKAASTQLVDLVDAALDDLAHDCGLRRCKTKTGEPVPVRKRREFSPLLLPWVGRR